MPSDAPKGADIAEDQIGVQSDMASFASASGSGSDEDLLSSIASDVKTVKKEKDVSLLRELKDFKAPADEIESELKDMFDRMSVIQKPKEKNRASCQWNKINTGTTETIVNILFRIMKIFLRNPVRYHERSPGKN